MPLGRLFKKMVSSLIVLKQRICGEVREIPRGSKPTISYWPFKMMPKEGPARKVYPGGGEEEKTRQNKKKEEEMVSFPFLRCDSRALG